MNGTAHPICLSIRQSLFSLSITYFSQYSSQRIIKNCIPSAAIGHCVRSSVCPSVSVRPERRYRSNSLRISAISLKFRGMMPSTMEQMKIKMVMLGQFLRVPRNFEIFYTILSQFGPFPTISPVWVHGWLRKDAHHLTWHRRGALLFAEVIRQISMSHGPKSRRFWPELSVSGLYLQFNFTHGFEIM